MDDRKSSEGTLENTLPFSDFPICKEESNGPQPWPEERPSKKERRSTTSQFHKGRRRTGGNFGRKGAGSPAISEGKAQDRLQLRKEGRRIAGSSGKKGAGSPLILMGQRARDRAKVEGAG